MANLEILRLGDQDTIRKFLDQADQANPFQDPAFSGSDSLGGGLADHWFVVKNDERISMVGYGIENFALGRYLPRQRSLSFPKGPIAQDGAALPAGLRLLEQSAREWGMIYVDVNPQWTDHAIDDLDTLMVGLAWNRLDATASMTLKLDLTREPDDLFAGFDKGTRYEVRRAQRLGIDVKFATTLDEYDSFYDCYRKMGLRKGFDGIERKNYLSLVARIQREPSRGAVLTAMKGYDFLGGIVILRGGSSLHYVYGATTDRPDLRKLPIAHLLQWRAIEWARQLGLRTYDFGGYTANTDSGVAKFKSGFGGVPVRIAPRYRKILRPWVHGLGSQLRKVKGR